MDPLVRRAALRVPPVRRLAGRRIADRPYRLLLSHGQVRPLDRRELRMLDEYAVDVLGDVVHAHGLRLYMAIRGGFRPGWIPDTYFGARVVSSITGAEVRRIGRVRTLMTALVGVDGVPEVGNRIGGRWYDRARRPVSRAAVAAAAAEHGPTVVVKLDATQSGRGAHVLTVGELRATEPAPGPDLTVQHVVPAHPDLAALSPGSTPPLRITTVLRDGEPSFAASHLRFGTRGAPVTGGLEALAVAVPIEGALGDLGIDGSGRLHRRHPATGAPFAGLRVPSFADAVERCLEGHRRIPQAGIVGWDVAIDPPGAVHVLEWNLFWPGIELHEILSGPVFTDLGWERFALHAGSGGSVRRR